MLFSAPQLAFSADKSVISQLNQSYDVSRLEFALFKTQYELNEELKKSYGLNKFNDVYYDEDTVNYELSTSVSDDDIFIFLNVNQYLVCDDKKLKLIEDYMPKVVRLKADKLATEIFHFFGHSGDYEQLNVAGENIIHVELAKRFLQTSSDNARWVSEENLKIASEIADLMKIAIRVEYCPKNESFETENFLRIYRLNSNYAYRTEDGQLFSDIEEL